ncbi:DUF309 domain-containing protein [Laceyella tengchongensis]|jgi:uncharacterized protein
MIFLRREKRGLPRVWREERELAMYHTNYLSFFRHYHAEEYWEAHEVLEELWQTQRDNDFYHGLIQIAAIMHQLKRGKVRGARKLATSAYRYLSPFRPERDGVDVEVLLMWLALCLERLPEGQAVMALPDLEQLSIPVGPLPRLHEMGF